jgi:hypothetical protein
MIDPRPIGGPGQTPDPKRRDRASAPPGFKEAYKQVEHVKEVHPDEPKKRKRSEEQEGPEEKETTKASPLGPKGKTPLVVQASTTRQAPPPLVTPPPRSAPPPSNTPAVDHGLTTAETKRSAPPVEAAKHDVPPPQKKISPEKKEEVPPEAAEEEVAALAPPLPAQTVAKVKEKESMAISETTSSQFGPPSAQPGLISFATPTGPAPFVYLHPKAYEYFERMVSNITVMLETGVTTTTITLNEPTGSIFAGTQISIAEFSTAPKAFNIEITGSSEAVAIFDSNMDDLSAAFANYKEFSINRLEARIRPLVRRKESVKEEKK